MRLGISDLEKSPRFEGVDRTVIEVVTHPKFKFPEVYFDVAIATAGELVLS